MITLRKSADRGVAEHGWLSSRHSFSFAEYQDPAHMGFGNLRVINEDVVAPGMGFGTHGHRDMEIVSYVLSGELAHADSLGNGGESGRIRPGDVQRMSAGTGVRHSEFNASRSEPVHFLQIWLLPRRAGIAPGYEQKHFAQAQRRGRLCLVASEDGREGSLVIHADCSLHAALLDGPEQAAVPLAAGRRGYVHVARGSVSVNGQALQAGDAALLQGEGEVRLGTASQAEVLVFDLA